MEIFEFDVAKGRYRYDRSYFANKAGQDVWSPWTPLPRSKLTIDQQQQHLDYVYGSKEIKDLLAPPLQEIELVALEMVYERRIGPLLRHYLLHISREVVVAENQRFVIPRVLKGEVGHRPAFHVLVNHCGGCCCYTAVSHVADTTFMVVNDDSVSPGLPLHETLSRPALGRGAIDRLKGYPRLSELVPAEELRDRGLTLGALGKFRVSTDRDTECIIDEALRSAQQVSMCVKILMEATVIIQKRFRLWRWRRDVVWNPYTEDGQNHLRWKARIFVRKFGG